MCTDVDASAEQVIKWYAARFQIEFVFRDSKQHTGLSHAQIRNKKGIDFHINASMTALNLLRLQDRREMPPGVCSIASIKRRNYNQTFINLIFSKLAIDPTSENIRPHIEELRRFGSIAA